MAKGKGEAKDVDTDAITRRGMAGPHAVFPSVDGFDWSNISRYHNFDATPDTEF